MATVTFDTLAAVHRLRDAGYDEPQAEAIVRVISDAQGQLVTRVHFDARISQLPTIWQVVGIGFAQVGLILTVI